MQRAGGWLRLRTDEDGLVSTQFKIWLCLIIGIAFSIIAVLLTDRLYKDSLKSRSQSIAITIDTDRINELRTLQEGPDIDRQYVALKLRLAELKLVNDDARSIYVISHNQMGIFTVADSESTDSKAYAPRGAEYGPVSSDAESLFETRGSHIEGPQKDSTGTHLTAFSSVVDRATGQAIGLVGLDIPVSTYYSLLTLSAIVPLIIAMGVGILIVFSDKSRARRLEGLRFRSELVSIASHELRTPLTGIKWSEEILLKNKSLGEAERNTINSMYESTMKLQESIEDVLQLASLQNKHASGLQTTPTDMTKLIEGIFSMQKLPAEQHHITLKFDHDWPKNVTISCDMLRMKRVLNNLVSNAIKYTLPNTSVIVGYDKVEGQHILTITDQGIGIPEDEQQKVFSGFYRATNAVQKETNGTGMGLYLSQTVINQHGGKIWLKSKVNKGTTVYVQLP